MRAAGARSGMKRPSLTASLLWPALIVILPLLLGPLVVLVLESLKPHVAGRLGGDDNAAMTLANYADLAGPEYARYFFDTFKIGLISTGWRSFSASPWRISSSAGPAGFCAAC